MMGEYIVLGIGDTGQSVSEKISALPGSDANFSVHLFQKFTDFKKEYVATSNGTKAIFLVLRLGDSYGDEFISELDAFILETMAPVYAVVSYPFLWEGPIRIPLADKLLEALIRICDNTFRIESHQWFPLKEELGFHGVVELVHKVAADVLLAIIKQHSIEMGIAELGRISTPEHVEAIKQDEKYWIITRRAE